MPPVIPIIYIICCITCHPFHYAVSQSSIETNATHTFDTKYSETLNTHNRIRTAHIFFRIVKKTVKNQSNLKLWVFKHLNISDGWTMHWVIIIIIIIEIPSTFHIQQGLAYNLQPYRIQSYRWGKGRFLIFYLKIILCSLIFNIDIQFTIYYINMLW